MFNAAHLHIAINHLPVVGFMAAFVLSICAFFTKDRMLDLTAWMFTAGCALTAVISYLTGEPAEEMISGTSGVSDAFMSAHMRWGQYTYWATIAIGALSLVGWFLAKRKEDSDRKALILLIIMLFAANFLGALTASLGGDIRHPEIHGDKAEQIVIQLGLRPEEREMLQDEPKWKQEGETDEE
jgi:uncharacterized membrane protein